LGPHLRCLQFSHRRRLCVCVCVCVCVCGGSLPEVDVWWGGAVPYDRQLSPPKTHPPPPVQLLVAVRSPVRPPSPSLATESPQQLGKARGEESHGFGELGSPAAKSGGIGNPPEGASGSRRPAAGPRARGSWPKAGARGRRSTPRRALQGAARPAGLGSDLSARPRALGR
jgi:hypothetical protein